jgi:hypothetical protein
MLCHEAITISKPLQVEKRYQVGTRSCKSQKLALLMLAIISYLERGTDARSLGKWYWVGTVLVPYHASGQNFALLMPIILKTFGKGYWVGAILVLPCCSSSQNFALSMLVIIKSLGNGTELVPSVQLVKIIWKLHCLYGTWILVLSWNTSVPQWYHQSKGVDILCLNASYRWIIQKQY